MRKFQNHLLLLSTFFIFFKYFRVDYFHCCFLWLLLSLYRIVVFVVVVIGSQIISIHFISINFVSSSHSGQKEIEKNTQRAQRALEFQWVRRLTPNLMIKEIIITIMLRNMGMTSNGWSFLCTFLNAFPFMIVIGHAICFTPFAIFIEKCLNFNSFEFF